MAIQYKLRQENQGAYLFDRRHGSVRRLSQPEFNLLQELKQVGAPPLDWPQNGVSRHFGLNTEDGQHWWGILESMGLADEATLNSLQVITVDENLASGCLAAPARVYFELTRQCNLTCRTCFNGSRRPLAGELSTLEIQDAITQLDRMGTFEIRFTGGEPTEHPDFLEIITFAGKHGFYISLGTNGEYSSWKRSWIYEAGINWFIISLDGDEEINDWVRGSGTYRQVIQTLQELSVRPGVRVRLNMVVARHNVGAVEALARLADEHGVESLNLIPLRPYGRSVKNLANQMFSQHDFYLFIRSIQELRQRYRVKFSTTLDLLDPEPTTSHDPIVQKKNTCAAGVEACVIGATGDIYGCSYSPASFPYSHDAEGRRLFVAGNLRSEPIKTIWQDSTRWAVFRDLEKYKNLACQTCRHYQMRCVGSCPIMGYFKEKAPNACDPYCFSDLLDMQTPVEVSG